MYVILFLWICRIYSCVYDYYVVDCDVLEKKWNYFMVVLNGKIFRLFIGEVF